MMRAPMSREMRELLDEVEDQPGWRVEDTRMGWRIYPADHSIPVIQTRGLRDGGDPRAMENLRATLRRAGYPPLQRPPRSLLDMPVKPTATPATVATLHAPNGAAVVATPATPAAPAAVVTRNLVREARVHIQTALDALSSIDQILGEIEGERDQIQRLKEMFASVLK